MRSFWRVSNRFLLGVSALSLAGCGLVERENGWICASLPDLQVDELQALDPQERLDRCITKWGYRLARSPDPARTVADATFAACKGFFRDVEIAGFSEAEVIEQAKDKALLAVVQARAGRCAIPEVV